MAIDIGRYKAAGPFTNLHELENRSGVYVILTHNGSGESWHVVDIGEAHAVRNRVANHDRRPCWNLYDRGVLACAPIYTPNAQQQGRMAIEQELRRQFSPDCGER